MSKLFIIIFIFSSSLHSKDIQNFNFVKYDKNNILTKVEISNGDIYSFFYNSKIQKCELRKNNQLIATYDKRFKRKKPNVRAYRCTSWTKENYHQCRIIKSKSVSSVALSFGRFVNTNLLIAINPDYYKADAYLKIKCIK